MNPPALSPAARLVLLAIDEATTVDDVARILVREKVVVAPRAIARANSVLDALHTVGAVVVHVDETWTVTPRGERFRDWLLRELAGEGKRPAKASDTTKPSQSRSKPSERTRTPKAAAPEPSSDDRIEFVAASGAKVILFPFRQKSARGVK